MQNSYIIFQVADTDYAVRIESIQQVEMIEKVTRIPNAPEFVDGVVYLRGKVAPVINLRSRFHVEKIPYSLSSRLIVIQVDGRTVGLAVDSAREFIKIAPDEIILPPETLAGPGVEYLEGVATIKDRIILVINIQQLLSEQEREKLSETSPVKER